MFRRYKRIFKNFIISVIETQKFKSVFLELLFSEWWFSVFSFQFFCRSNHIQTKEYTDLKNFNNNGNDHKYVGKHNWRIFKFHFVAGNRKANNRTNQQMKKSVTKKPTATQGKFSAQKRKGYLVHHKQNNRTPDMITKA